MALQIQLLILSGCQVKFLSKTNVNVIFYTDFLSIVLFNLSVDWQLAADSISLTPFSWLCMWSRRGLVCAPQSNLKQKRVKNKDNCCMQVHLPNWSSIFISSISLLEHLPDLITAFIMLLIASWMWVMRTLKRLLCDKYLLSSSELDFTFYLKKSNDQMTVSDIREKRRKSKARGG